MQNLQSYEEMTDVAPLPLSTYFVDDQHKNLLSVLKHTDPALSALRIKVRRYFIELNSLCYKHEPIKEQFKRQMAQAKIIEKQQSSQG